jgi:hypothetical protein
MVCIFIVGPSLVASEWAGPVKFVLFRLKSPNLVNALLPYQPSIIVFPKHSRADTAIVPQIVRVVKID